RRTTPAAPIRSAHIGLGAFFRAHQAWYTDRSPGWGIAAFTGRSPAAAEALAGQDGLYHLVTRAADGDTVELVTTISSAYDGNDAAAWDRTFALPDLSVVTLTVTEAGYRAGAPVHDRLLAAFAARRDAGSGPIAVVPCDNLPHNGALLEALLADRAEDGMRAWLSEHVSYVSTVVDRITPATTADVRDVVRAATGFADAMPVVTEPFTEWVLAGTFPSGRPEWELGGARFVDDVSAYENRKLWLLNGAHSLLAYAGSARGHTTVAEAIADDELLGRVEQWWDEAAPHVGLETHGYRVALLARWRNPRIEHRLAQIAGDGSQKLPVRVLPVARAELAAGREPLAAAGILAAWIAHLRGAGAPVTDTQAATFVEASGGPPELAVPRVLRLLGAEDLAPLVRRLLA
ncbi:MAG: fructuronate reductase, partial [Frankiaceae bacterium]|nr:fructuronate reductase [Frankiaceae bacterium]